MKLKIDLKDPRIKRGVVIALPIVFALTAAVSIAMLVKPSTGAIEAPPEEEIRESVTEEEIPVIAPTETEAPDPYSKGLEFISRGNGSCVLAGIGSCTDTLITVPPKSPDGEVVTEIAVGAFAGSVNIVEITIPDTVIAIGDGAFSGCSRLEAIVVGDANPLFSTEDGVLFNKTKTTLLRYPEGRGEAVYTLPRSVTRIAEGAFTVCTALTEISYSGTKAQWNAIYVAPDNRLLENVNISCASADK